MSFWGLILKGNSTQEQTVPDDHNLVVTQASVESAGGAGGQPNTLYVETEGVSEKLSICTLTWGRSEHARLDLIFEAGRVIKFSVKGKDTIHLVGYYSVDDAVDSGDEALKSMYPGESDSEDSEDFEGVDDEEDEEGEDEDDEDDEDEESPLANGAKRLQDKQGGGNQKKPKNEQPKQANQGQKKEQPKHEQPKHEQPKQNQNQKKDNKKEQPKQKGQQQQPGGAKAQTPNKQGGNQPQQGGAKAQTPNKQGGGGGGAPQTPKPQQTPKAAGPNTPKAQTPKAGGPNTPKAGQTPKSNKKN